MKYIRVNSGIFEVEREERAYFEPQPKLYVCKNHIGYIIESSIIKQADNIEELCDEYILVHKDSNVCNLTRNLSDTERKDLLNMNWEWYGAVWIHLSNGGWRLEPVAKLNEERKLVLL